MLYCGLEDWKASLTADHDAPTLIQHLVDSYAVQPQVTAAPTPALSPAGTPLPAATFHRTNLLT